MLADKQNPCPSCGRRRSRTAKGPSARPKFLDALARGEKLTAIALALGIPRATVYRVKAGAGVTP